MYTCICNTSDIRLKLDNETFACIIDSYSKYLSSRGLDHILHPKYINEITRLKKYSDDTISYLILKESSLDRQTGFGKSQVYTLQLTSPHFTGYDIYKYIEYACLREIVTFINKHIFSEDLANDISVGEAIFNQMKAVNF